MIQYSVPAQVGLLGSPSDGYRGRTIAITVNQFQAMVTLEPLSSSRVEIIPNPSDAPSWIDLATMTSRVDRYGYKTGPQVLAATIRTFASVAESLAVPLQGGFRLCYETAIPRQVGLGGSSALVIAALRCLQDHFGLPIPDQVLPTIAFRAETSQLGVAGDLGDRVAQVYGGLVSMNFTAPVVHSRFGVSHGAYEVLDQGALPPLFVSYRLDAPEPGDDYYPLLRTRYEAGDRMVRETLHQLAALAIEGRAALAWKASNRFSDLLRQNTKLRRRLGHLPGAQEEMIEVANSLGSPATHAGSGGAIVGHYQDTNQLNDLTNALSHVGAVTTAITPITDPEAS